MVTATPKSPERLQGFQKVPKLTENKKRVGKNKKI